MLVVSASAKLGHAVWALGMTASIYVVYAGAKYLIAAAARKISPRHPSEPNLRVPFWRLRDRKSVV
jgi:hypothetical protein